MHAVEGFGSARSSIAYRFQTIGGRLRSPGQLQEIGLGLLSARSKDWLIKDRALQIPSREASRALTYEGALPLSKEVASPTMSIGMK